MTTFPVGETPPRPSGEYSPYPEPFDPFNPHPDWPGGTDDVQEWVWLHNVETYWPGAKEETVVYGPHASSYDDGEPTYRVLHALLLAAMEQCFEFAPRLPPGARIPERYRLAQVMQARALWRSMKAGSGNQMGADGMVVTVFPMDWTVKALLRPKTGRPRVG